MNGFQGDGNLPMFAQEAESAGEFAPLAERMRPSSLGDYVGQEHLLGPGRLLSRMVAAKKLVSLVLWGGPGSGKTTLARLLAESCHVDLLRLSATDAGVKELRAAAQQALSQRRTTNRMTALFVDEIHRLNKTQQDALLPHVESGACLLIGATTEAPSATLNPALLSRVRVVQLRPLATSDIAALVQRALTDEARGLGHRRLNVSQDVCLALAQICSGDARKALNTLEIASDLVEPGDSELSLETLAVALGRRVPRYDRDGSQHFDCASALIKSMRASDPEAAMYWMTRMIEGGEEANFVSRRLVIFASEDIGNAEPSALALAVAAHHAVEAVGMPEAKYALAQAVLFLSLAPKSNWALRALRATSELHRQAGSLPVPPALVRGTHAGDAPATSYRYPHDYDKGIDPAHTSYLPAALAKADATIAGQIGEPGSVGWEARAYERLSGLRGRPASSQSTDASASSAGSKLPRT